jgi:hypothetical protein
VARKSVKTSIPPNPMLDGKPFLYFSQDKKLFKKNLGPDFIYDPQELVHKFDQSIISLDNHMSKEVIFVLDEMGQIFKLDSNLAGSRGFHKTDVKIPGLTGLSVDWLHDLIYLTSKQGSITKIFKCSLGKIISF